MLLCWRRAYLICTFSSVQVEYVCYMFGSSVRPRYSMLIINSKFPWPNVNFFILIFFGEKFSFCEFLRQRAFIGFCWEPNVHMSFLHKKA